MLPTTGSTMTAAMSSPCSAKTCFERASTSLKGAVMVFGGDRGGDAGAVGQAERRDAGAGLDEQAVAVAVVAALELDDLVAAGRAAREAERGHRRLRPAS